MRFALLLTIATAILSTACVGTTSRQTILDEDGHVVGEIEIDGSMPAKRATAVIEAQRRMTDTVTTGQQRGSLIKMAEHASARGEPVSVSLPDGTYVTSGYTYGDYYFGGGGQYAVPLDVMMTEQSTFGGGYHGYPYTPYAPSHTAPPVYDTRTGSAVHAVEAECPDDREPRTQPEEVACLKKQVMILTRKIYRSER